MVRNNSEHKEQCAVIQWCNTFKNKYSDLDTIFAIPNGGHRHMAVAIKLKAEGVKSGVPDLFLPVPVDFFAGLFIEMKIPGNQATTNQLRWLKRLESLGYRVKIAYSWIEAVNFICDYLGIDEKVK